MRFSLLFLFITFLQFSGNQILAQSPVGAYPFDSSFFSHYKFRSIGPFRGGRASGVCGDPKNKQVFYMASTGGGVWKTKDGGQHWKNISDRYFGGSIGAIEVCPSDPLLMYAGGGESTLRGNVSEGQGIYKSVDGGKSWTFCGLEDSRHISRIVFDPKNPERVYVAVMGHLFGPNENRGVYKTENGGQSWEKILYSNEQSGAADLVMDPVNPRVLYATTWRVIRTPYSMESGGEGSAIWKSTDAGETWTNISKNKGLPKDTLGMICLAVSASNSDKIYAMVENKQAGGLYMSTDAGLNWVKQNDESKIRQRAWYFSRLFVDPKQEDLLYVCNVELHKSNDGGKTFQTIHTPHADHHNMWIDPEDGQRMIIADDGGAQISFDGGAHWSTYHNQPTAQFYRVTADNHFPYRVLGCQQDNSSVRIMSRTYGGSITQQDWSSSAGFESGHIVADPLNDDIVYGGNYGGYLSRLNHRTGENRTVSVYPVSPIGEGADTLKYRFQWNFPIFFSPHNPKRLYAAGNHLFVSENEGQSWQKISPDLTTNDKKKQAPSGGIITKDNTSVEYYCTIFAAAESPVQKDLLWSGSDDGLIHVSDNAGASWDLVNPRNMPEGMMINCIEPDPFDAQTCYVVGTRYKLDDQTPYLYKTNDLGNTWEEISEGIPSTHFTRCLRADPNHKGTMYCGTEQGLYVSFDAGKQWLPLQLNLPLVPITDLCIKNDDLIVATQGRSFWILDQLNTLHQFHKTNDKNEWKIFQPALSYRMDGYRKNNPDNEGENPYYGTIFHTWIPEWQDSSRVTLRIMDESGKEIRVFSTTASEKDDQIKLEKGMNILQWNHQVKGCEKIDGMVLWNGNIGNYKVPPGNYKASFRINQDSTVLSFRIAKDPNYQITETDYRAQYEMLTKIRDKFEAVQNTVKQIRKLRADINNLKDQLKDSYPAELDSLGKDLVKKTTQIEERLHQTKAKSGQDVLNYPIRINDKLSGLFDAVNQHTAPTAQSIEAWEDLKLLADQALLDYEKLKSNEVRAYNQMIHVKQIDYLGASE